MSGFFAVYQHHTILISLRKYQVLLAGMVEKYDAQHQSVRSMSITVVMVSGRSAVSAVRAIGAGVKWP